MRYVLKQLFSLILPFTVLIVVPYSLERDVAAVVDGLFAVGVLFTATGLGFLVVTVSTFIRIGKGTLAPWSPTKKLIVGGLYSYVRNPMITGVFITLLGETMILHSVRILMWAIAFFIINSIYFVLSEEPGMVKRFGNEYLEYKRNVPRWIPRLKPWKPDR